MPFFVSGAMSRQPTTLASGSVRRTLPLSPTGGTNNVALAALMNPLGVSSPYKPFPDGFLPDVVRDLFEQGWTREPIGDNIVVWMPPPDVNSPTSTL